MQWSRDVLGADFSMVRIPVPGDGVHTTMSLVRYDPGPLDQARGVVLYVHGWSDYFANPELAQHVAQAGFHFYAMDLHGYGRNLTDDVLATGQVPGTTADLRHYQPDFDAAQRVITMEHGPQIARNLVVIAHSTGGLIMSLLLMETPQPIVGLALATPWIAPQGWGWLDPLMAACGKFVPPSWGGRRLPVRVNTNYHRSLSNDRDGEWFVDPRWRPKDSFPLTVNFLVSTARARLRLLELARKGNTVGAPVLLQISRRSLLVPWWEERMHTVDTVLDVVSIRRRIARLHPIPRVINYDGAIHDVHRSAPTIRQRAFRDLQDWLSSLPLG